MQQQLLRFPILALVSLIKEVRTTLIMMHEVLDLTRKQHFIFS
jgi:hypothetical protein